MPRINHKIISIMGRQQGIIRYTGRLGNTVGYLAKDGKGNSFDATRVLAATVTNPQTVAQMTQRMKMAPVVNFYRGLRSLLDHSWQGVKYGEPSRLFFYSQTLRALSTAGVPYIAKGDKKFVPWSFPISQGSIPVSIKPVVTDANDGNMTLNIDHDGINDLGELSIALENTYVGLRDGMQLTFIWVYESNGLYVPSFKRLTLDSGSTLSWTDLGISFNAPQGESDCLITNLNANGEPIEEQIAAAGIIVSALVGNTWERNTSSMVIANKLVAQYNSQSAFDAMLASYRATSNSNESDWYLNGGGDEGGSSTVSIVREVTLETSTGTKTIAYYKVGGTKYAPYYTATLEQQPMICGYRKGGDMAFTKAQSIVLSGAPISDELKTEYLALGYTLCTRAELLAIAPELTIPE